MSTESGNIPVPDKMLEQLNNQQSEIYVAKIKGFKKYLLTKGKDRKKGIGYPESSVPERISRFNRVNAWLWSSRETTTEFTTEHADYVVNALNTDEMRTQDGARYSGDSKRKIKNVLDNWFEYNRTEWECDLTFSNNGTSNNSDPFTRKELRQIWQASLKFEDIPSYNNLSPNERDHWKAYIAQKLSKPKDDVVPADWESIKHCWKIPSLIRTARSSGWRPALINRMKVGWYDSAGQKIVIPGEFAVKNDIEWEQHLTDEGALALENWLDQRKNIERYDGRDEMWLTREGNGYDSSSLNRLLRKLLDEIEIAERGRKLTWYSFRHSVGTYVYDEYQDLEIVADRLRQKSTRSAARYVHPTSELRKEAADVV